MTYENLVNEAAKAVKTVDVKAINEHLAVEFDIEGKGEGAFYVEFTSGKVDVQPYEYYDHDFRVRTDGTSAIAMLKGELDPQAAIQQGKAKVEGNVAKIILLAEHLKPAPVVEEVKAPEKKEEVKKEEAKKVEEKPVSKKVVKKPVTKKVLGKK